MENCASCEKLKAELEQVRDWNDKVKQGLKEELEQARRVADSEWKRNVDLSKMMTDKCDEVLALKAENEKLREELKHEKSKLPVFIKTDPAIEKFETDNAFITGFRQLQKDVALLNTVNHNLKIKHVEELTIKDHQLGLLGQQLDERDEQITRLRERIKELEK